ncbi:Cuticle protein 19 [Trachymyrmex septentrionalis]|uniref:Cuticle protein 19 n=1 Tax=Trachymyrmex septentrionalis TaxID=34720 RepID=A0A195FET5_9HYME|nr:Cuticle protein 19 [Trachymyrmex septentrionalis]
MATICRQLALLLAVLALAAIQSGIAGHAHSFAHFHGPVVGPGHELIVHDKHGHHHVDYIAHPKYKFAYGVEDHHTSDYHGQKEHRDDKISLIYVTFFSFVGKKVIGEYTIKEPGGNTRTVTYHADPHGGFFAHVHNSGGNNHHGGTYGGYGHY